MIAAGIGAMSRATAEEIVSALHSACTQANIQAGDIDEIAGLARPETAAALRQAATALKLTLRLLESDALQTAALRCATRSERALAAAGVPSVAEALALTAAGVHSKLLLTRQAFATVTVALASTSS